MQKFIFFTLILVLAANAQEIGAKYLIITHDSFYNDIQPLAEWKHKKGVRTKVVTLSQIGSSSSQIKTYIQNAYNTWQIPPEFVLLVGSPNLLPWGPSTSDNYYMEMTGDLFNDIIGGRLTVHNTTEAQTVVNKILLYERYPNLTDSLWFTNACLIVREDYDTHDDSIYWSDIRHAKNLMLSTGYNIIDTLSRAAGHSSSDIIQAVNNGRAFVMYRGQGVNNWWSPFGVNPNSTSNGEMLPIVLSITCSTIGTSGSPATAEEWLLTGSPTSPRGGCAYFATTTVISGGAHLRSAVAKGFFTGVFEDKLPTFGEACEAGRLNVYNLWGSTSEYNGFKTLGDPEMNIWTGIPKQINVAHVPSVSGTDDTLLVTVTSNEAPVESALVCIMLDTTLYEHGYTDAGGEIVFDLMNLHPGQMDITVTGRNLLPYEALITVVDDNPFLGYISHTIDDALGNNNGIPENGETILLYTLIKNVGLAEAIGVQATIRSDDNFISIIDSVSYFGNIAPNDSAYNLSPYVFSISPSCPDLHTANFVLVMEDTADNTWTDGFHVVIVNNDTGPWTGPDEYGYYMYDDTDTLTGYAPTFDWYNDSMSLVNEITDEDADTVTYALPFDFPFYGITYNSIGLCSNGFMEMGTSTFRFGANTGIPQAGGPTRLIAPFWDDLDPRDSLAHGDIYYGQDSANQRWIVEFRSVGHFEDSLRRETFQIQFRDPQYYPTPTGDGEILFLYDTVSYADSNTVGIEDHTQTRGIQYVYDGSYHPYAAPLVNGRAILVTTNAPAGIWLHTIYFTFDDSTGGNNNGIIEPGETIDIYASIQNSGNATANDVVATLRTADPDAIITDSIASYGTLAGGATATNYGSPYVAQISATPSDTAIGFTLYMSCNSGAYQKSDYFTFFVYGSPGVEEQKAAALNSISLNVYPNPFKHQLAIRCAGLNQILGFLNPGEVHLKVYDVCGRVVKSFNELTAEQVTWNGTDDNGRHVASGVYFVDLNIRGNQQGTKVILMK